MMTDWGTTAAGDTARLIELSEGDLTVLLCTFGARIHSVRLEGVDHDLTLPARSLRDYEGEMGYHGALVGPVVNRIGGARATIDGEEVSFEGNQDGRVTLHSGDAGTWNKVWQVVEAADGFAHLAVDLPDGEGGFPGNRRIEAVFELRGGALTMTVTATTDAPTLMNCANHSYWRVEDSDTWEGWTLTVDADHVTEVDADTVPTGRILPVEETGLDCRTGKVLRMGDFVADDNLCLSDTRQDLREVASLRGGTGTTLRISTTETGLQVWDGRKPAGGYAPYCALALEAQAWPDAPHHDAFPSILLVPGEEYRAVTRWAFARD
ncbi:aldose epimerase family protein [Wenxinia saemankumensis]|uniref:Aldose 1-epimerase n=1 Tax=Wenxinia saemankumensis TaxID=1447782 RepID=A0A1M6E4P8_9RHOB|nr:aldose epimerase family protein [Wenxinia saemankumensis]SHI80476.1 aldose 1-epimerase [Wenxinia saemankumensis]